MATQELLDSTFDAIVLKSQGLVLVNFWAEWCGPCKIIGPVLEEISDEMASTLVVAKLNIDNNPLSPAKYNVRGVPTSILFKNGMIVGNMVGVKTKTQLTEWIHAFLNL